MELNFRTILEDHLKTLNATVTMAAYSVVPTGTCVPEYTSDYFRFVYVTRGNGWLVLNGKRYASTPGQLFMMPAGSKQSYGVDGDESCEVYWCHFHANLGAGELFDMLNFPVCIEPKRADFILDCFNRMVTAFHALSLTGTLRVKGALLEIFAEYLDSFELGATLNPDMDLFVKLSSVIGYIEDHLADNISLDDLARMAFLHPNYFIVLFKNVMGVSPIQYVNCRRLEKAKRLLAESDDSVSDIADTVGMSNHYLSRLFKQQIGISPKRYRQLCKTVERDGRHVVSVSHTYVPAFAQKGDDCDDG